MVLAAYENVMVAVPGLPPESVVTLAVTEDGLAVGEFGTLLWAGSQLAVEDRAPKGVRITMARGDGTPSVFFVPVSSLPPGLTTAQFTAWLDHLAAGAGAAVEGTPSLV